MSEQLVEAMKAFMNKIHERTVQVPSWVFYKGRYYYNDRPGDVEMLLKKAKYKRSLT